MSDHFALLYDRLMADAPYKEWEKLAVQKIPQNGSVLDLGCGTGTLTIYLALSGYNVTGLDLSGDMLAVAQKKAQDERAPVTFVQQDMRELTGFNRLDGVTLFCDGLNYLTDEADVCEVFRRVYDSLTEGGVFVFDVHSPYKMTDVFADGLFGENGEDISYLWFCEQGEKPLSVEHTLTFFVRAFDGRYERVDHELTQRTFLIDDYRKWLEDCGFTDVDISADFGREKPDEASDRIFFSAVKK
ncbi:class I SAM-dependent DNA methyltransferase [Salisediminibacterium halotolerans]|uniref:Ubiquinone/menaquinone biosynthesis C-methylase UbiE n=1 Tax=Salisediminibacterium halotolerans TaxID=517425 RepID=A0A1H9S6V8_9BACI|nr:class I SAM-dependent methyltransferase [Salisediminibacterium haloalkalitolerans]SER79899.1 Ubiquinone/menaquinone biosynthesis C-methylase UbiE [Salisediminibacterium haloalkalitolerans]